MSTNDFIPNADVDFNLWQGNLISTVDLNMVAWGIPPDEVAAIKAKQTAWTTVFMKASNRQNRSHAEVHAKNLERKPFEKDLRKFVAQWLANNGKITAIDRDRMDITVKSETRLPVAVPFSSPVGRVDYSVRQQHTLHFVDSLTNAKAKPKGVHGCEVWMKAGGEVPVKESDFDYQAVVTRSPYIVSFLTPDVGKVVYYKLRWVNQRGKTGPWSTVISAIVGA